MKDENKTKAQLINQLAEMRQRIAEFEAAEVERNLADKRLRLLYSAIEQSNEGLVVVDLEGRLQMLNKSFAAVHGYTPEELIGKHLSIFHTPEQLPAVKAANKQILETGEFNGEIWHVRRDGTTFPALMRNSLLRDEKGAAIGMVGALCDITSHKQAEESLRRRNRELALLNRVGQELAATLDLQRVIERLLQEVTEIVGTEGASVWLWDEKQDGWLVCWALFTHGKERSPSGLRVGPGQGFVGWVAEAGESVIVANAQDTLRFFPDIDKQIDFHTTSLLATPLQVRDAIVGVLEVVNKLSGAFDENDLALVETLSASAAVAIDNARLVEALRQYAAELEARNEDLDAFAHTVAHDLNNPLTHIIGFAELLEQDHALLSNEELERYLHTIVRAGHKMNNITGELLLLASAHMMEEVEIKPLNMADIVAEVLERLAYLIEGNQAKITLPDSWPTALGYGPWVEEVWVNYLSNAIKYGSRSPQVELGATDRADGTVRFWVRDDGPGISPQDQPRLFTPFTRLENARARGHGLGLSIVRRIVEKLGGEAGVESKVGQGSLFYFTLPGMAI